MPPPPPSPPPSPPPGFLIQRSPGWKKPRSSSLGSGKMERGESSRSAAVVDEIFGEAVPELAELTPEICDELIAALTAPGGNLPRDPDFAARLDADCGLLSYYAAALRSGEIGGEGLMEDGEVVEGEMEELDLEDAAEGVLVSPSSPRKKRSRKRSRGGNLVHLWEDHDAVSQRVAARRTRILYDSLRMFCRGYRRADMEASKIMLDRGLYFYRDLRIVGAYPGISIGDVFMYRAELMVLGIHGASQAGIDFAPASCCPQNEPLATSVVVSGGYLDDHDEGNVIEYTGSGGRHKNAKDHFEDQKLEAGNLALERSIHYRIDIRVVRGMDCETSPSRRVYVYDGLYRAVNCREEIGKSGKVVYKYKLVRKEGQEELGSKKLMRAEQIKQKLNSRNNVSGYLTKDLSEGKELLPVAVFNDVDGNRDPLNFEYIIRRVLPSPVLPEPTPREGCSCTSECMGGCFCVKRNHNGCAYDENGFLLQGQPVVHECGNGCRCPVTCPNRLTQRGMRFRLEVFRSQEGYWGVQSLDVIPAGSFVCEFTGVVRRKSRLLQWSSTRLIDAGGFEPSWRDWGDVSSAIEGYQKPELPSYPIADYILDVAHKRNVARYLRNSSCPNLFVQYVLRGSEDEKFPHLAVFALENIPPLRELTIHKKA